jgi:hypothetical protein
MGEDLPPPLDARFLYGSRVALDEGGDITSSTKRSVQLVATSRSATTSFNVCLFLCVYSSSSVSLAFSDEENARLEAGWQTLSEEAQERAWRIRVSIYEKKSKDKKTADKGKERVSNEAAAGTESDVESERPHPTEDKRGDSGVSDPGE